MFANLKDGVLTINDYRFCDCIVTSDKDLKLAYLFNKKENLTCSINCESDFFKDIK